MSKHSPTPWRYGHTDTPLGAQIVDANGEAVACTSMRSGLGRPDPERKENGEHIVHCVNVHDELVAALAEIVLAYDFYSDRRASEKESGIEAARKLLKKAKVTP